MTYSGPDACFTAHAEPIHTQTLRWACRTGSRLSWDEIPGMSRDRIHTIYNPGGISRPKSKGP